MRRSVLYCKLSTIDDPIFISDYLCFFFYLILSIQNIKLKQKTELQFMTFKTFVFFSAKSCMLRCLCILSIPSFDWFQPLITDIM